MTRFLRWVIQGCAVILVVLAGWTADISYNEHGHMTAASVDAIITKVVIAIAFFAIAVAAQNEKR